MNNNLINQMPTELNQPQPWLPRFIHLPGLLGYLRGRLHRLKWAIPLSLVILVVGYELLPALWVQNTWGFAPHALMDVLLFGTIGPAIVYILLNFLERWLEERETSDLQAKILQKAQEDARHSRQLNDDAVQVLFSASTLIESLKTSHPELPSDTIAHIEITEKALDKAIRDLRVHLLD
ncbi:MAG: hypothetical protein ACE5FD_14600 [Anaerolineae bacterium]